jgi:sigma-B regulation protein RsbU (phosphoserine phosphatase)
MQLVVDLMRDLSRQTDPHEAAKMYGKRIRGLVPADGWLSLSRRDLEPPTYRITRSYLWKEEINPWKQKDRLPIFSTGLLGELLYSNEPQVIDDLPRRLRDDDPAFEHLNGFPLLVSLPQYDNGIALNLTVILLKDAAKFNIDRFPLYVWQSNLWGRATINLVLRQELTSAYDKLDREMRAVGDMQRALLPDELPNIPGLKLACHYQTSTRAGGDYYDFFKLADGRWGILIADVSGHGTPAAVMMAITHAISHLHPGSGVPPAELLNFLNRTLTERYTVSTGTFVTAFYSVYDPVGRTLTYARAGHNPPRLVRGTQVISLGAVGDLPLGIEADIVFEDRVQTLEPGDTLVLYTDGITEARNAADELFETSGLDQVLTERCGGPEKTLAAILAAVERFTGGRPATDDRTLLVASVVTQTISLATHLT